MEKNSKEQSELTTKEAAESKLEDLRRDFIAAAEVDLAGYTEIPSSTEFEEKCSAFETVLFLFRWQSQVIVFLMKRSKGTELYGIKVFVQDFVKRPSCNPNAGRFLVMLNRDWSSIIGSIKKRHATYTAAINTVSQPSQSQSHVALPQDNTEDARIISFPETNGADTHILSAHLSGLTHDEVQRARMALQPFLK